MQTRPHRFLATFLNKKNISLHEMLTQNFSHLKIGKMYKLVGCTTRPSLYSFSDWRNNTFGLITAWESYGKLQILIRYLKAKSGGTSLFTSADKSQIGLFTAYTKEQYSQGVWEGQLVHPSRVRRTKVGPGPDCPLCHMCHGRVAPPAS